MPASSAALRLLSDTGISAGPRRDARARLTVRVVSSNRLTGEGLAELLRQRTGFDVEAWGLEALLQPAPMPHRAVHIIVLDHGADRDQVVQLTARARRAIPGADIIVTGVVSRDGVGALVDAGVRAFVMRGASPDELIATIGTLAVESSAQQAPLIGVPIARDDAGPQSSPLPDEVLLTQREQQVVQLIVDGMCNKEIAAVLGVAIHTVKSHVHNILQKLSVGSRLALAAKLRHQSGWSTIGTKVTPSDKRSTP